MKFSIASDHREFFQVNKAIEFEGILTQDQLEQLINAVELVLSARLNISSKEISNKDPYRLFTVGRDLWRSNESIRKIVTNPHLTEIASELFGKKMMRLGYDQFLPSQVKQFLIEPDEMHTYSNLLQKKTSLKDISALQGVIGGMMICLRSDTFQNHETDAAQAITIFPLQSGNIVFFSADALMDFSQLTQTAATSYLMIVFVQTNSVYIMQQSDPLLHHFKQLGYNFGDKLLDRINPQVHKS